MSKEPYETPRKARDPNDLERHILDSTIAKTDAEWWAKRRIEELERTIEVWKASFVTKNEQFDALLADNARLQCCLLAAKGMIGRFDIIAILDRCLAATPEQSLARLRNQAIEKCAVELDGHWDMAAGIIRAMKEPE